MLVDARRGAVQRRCGSRRRWRGGGEHSSPPPGLASIGIVGVCTGTRTGFLIRADGSDGVAGSVVCASWPRLVELREELHAAGLTAAGETAFHVPPSDDPSMQRQVAVLDAWLVAQLSAAQRDHPRAASVIAKFLPTPSYLSLVIDTPSPSAPWVSDNWARRGVRATPTRLQAAQRRLAFALAELTPTIDNDDEDADDPASESSWLSSYLIVDLLCGDIQKRIGEAMQGIDYPINQPTPEALVQAVRGGVGSNPRLARARQYQTAELKRMIDAGANVDAETAFKDTPLKAAALEGNTAAITLLLDAKASVDHCGQTYSQRTPLLLASQAGHQDAVDLLLSRGADPLRRPLGALSDSVAF